MSAFVLRLALILTALFAALIGVVRLRLPTADDDAMRAVLIAPSSCASACWSGVEIGMSSADAVRLLGANPWISRVYAKTTFLTWDWSGAQPALIDAAHSGVIGLQNDHVIQIRIQTLIPFGSVWGMLGLPDHALLVRPVSRTTAYMIFRFSGVGINVISTLACPATPADLWDSTTTLGIGDVWTTEALNSIPFDVFHLPGWWRYLHECRPPLGTPAR